MACQAQFGVFNVCGDLIFPGGADKTFYVGYVGDLTTPFSLTQSGTITSLTFKAYKGFVKFEGQKYAHKYDWEYQKGAGGNGFYLHKATVKLIALSTQDDVEIQRLQQAQDAFILTRNNNDQFIIVGGGNGLSGSAGPLGSTGMAATDDVSDTVILEGAEKTKPLRFLVTDVAATLTYLDARVI